MNGKLVLILLGILSAWIALFIMFFALYQNVINTATAAISGGTYYPYFFGGGGLQGGGYLIGILICIMISTMCLTIGLGRDYYQVNQRVRYKS